MLLLLALKRQMKVMGSFKHQGKKEWEVKEDGCKMRQKGSLF